MPTTILQGLNLMVWLKYVTIINNNCGHQFKVLFLKVEMTLIAFIYKRSGKNESREIQKVEKTLAYLTNYCSRQTGLVDLQLELNSLQKIRRESQPSTHPSSLQEAGQDNDSS